MFKNYRLRDYDFKLIILILALSIIGIITIGSAEPAQQTKQMAGDPEALLADVHRQSGTARTGNPDG